MEESDEGARTSRQTGHGAAPSDGPRLLLLHVAGECSVSAFAAHAELEG